MINQGSKALFMLALALFVCGFEVATARAQNALPNLDSCLGRLDPQVDIGYDRIASRCPEMMRQLELGPWSPWLPRGWKEPGNDLSAGGLRELRDVIGRESAAAPSAREPDMQHLKTVLATLGAAANSESWWGRFKSWLRSILETREQPAGESWFSRMVSHRGLPQSVLNLIVYAALAGVVVLAGVIIANELRNAGLVPKRGAARGLRAKAANISGRLTDSRDIDGASLPDRPRLLLGLILKRLSERGNMPPSGALTVRELTRAARLREPDDQACLSDLALAAERVRYSADVVASETLREPLARGKELLERLEAGASG
jgi:hypothetical protein